MSADLYRCRSQTESISEESEEIECMMSTLIRTKFCVSWNMLTFGSGDRQGLAM
jgi:hypothetical protein